MKRYTPARVGLGREGVSLRTRDWLAFSLDCANAADAVRRPFDPEKVARELEAGGVRALMAESRARDKEEFLTRPDLGRSLSEASMALLGKEAARMEASGAGRPDVMFVVCDGHSSGAVHSTAASLVLEFFRTAPWDPGSLPPCVIVTRGRVAAADCAASAFKARVVVNLIGERPGLSSADSLGAYLTYGAFPGIHDGERNCISNIRQGGLPYREAAVRLAYLVESALAKGFTGTALKDDMPEGYLPFKEGDLLIG